MANRRINPNYCKTITLYNRLLPADNDGKEAWIRTTLTDCFFSIKTSLTASEGVLSPGGEYICRIPAQDAYKPYTEWKALTNKAETFTISKGDIVVLGTVTDEIDGTKGHRAADILLKYQPDAFRVMAFADNSRYPFGGHYKLGG